QKEQSKCRQGTGQSTRDKIEFSECHFLIIFKFPAGSVPPVRPDVTGSGTQKTDAGIGRRRWPGTLQGGAKDKVSAGGIPEQRQIGISECSSGLPLV
ncbi:unnamed protein product, partial [Staurois parvus]